MQQGHLGRNIGRLRELRGMKQETLANLLNVTQQAISKIEQCEDVTPSTLERIAKVLNVSCDTIRFFDAHFFLKNASINTGHSDVSLSSGASEKILELYAELLRCKDEIISLLEKYIALLEKDRKAQQ